MFDSPCCIASGATGAAHGGYLSNLSVGDHSYLTLLSSTNRALDFAVGTNKRICKAHHNAYLRHKMKRCVAPFCTNSSSKSLIDCSSRLLVYCQLHEEAKVCVHKKCYQQLRALDAPSNVHADPPNVSPYPRDISAPPLDESAHSPNDADHQPDPDLNDFDFHTDDSDLQRNESDLQPNDLLPRSNMQAHPSSTNSENSERPLADISNLADAKRCVRVLFGKKRAYSSAVCSSGSVSNSTSSASSRRFSSSSSRINAN